MNTFPLCYDRRRKYDQFTFRKQVSFNLLMKNAELKSKNSILLDSLISNSSKYFSSSICALKYAARKVLNSHSIFLRVSFNTLNFHGPLIIVDSKIYQVNTISSNVKQIKLLIVQRDSQTGF